MPDSVGAGGFPRNVNIGHEHLDLANGFTYQYLGDVPQNQLNWKIIGGIAFSPVRALGWGTKQIGAKWFDISEKVYKYWDGTQICTLKSIPSILNAYRSSMIVEEEFLSGGTFIGQYGWTFSGGTASYAISENNHNGICQRDTSAVATTLSYLRLGATDDEIDPSLIQSILFVIRPNQNDSDTQLRIGAMAPFGSNPPTNGIYFEKLYADTNWFFVTRAGGAQNRIDTGVQVIVDWATLTHKRTETGVDGYIDGRLVAQATLTIPTSLVSPGTQIINQAAASKTLDHDYFQMYVTGLTR